MDDSFYAINIRDIRTSARNNRFELKDNAKYDEVINALKGSESEYELIQAAAVYYFSMHNLMDEEAQISMRKDLIFDVNREMPYANEILSIVTEKSE